MKNATEGNITQICYCVSFVVHWRNLSTLLTCYKRLKFSFWQKVLTSSRSSSTEHELCKTGAMKKILVLHQNFLLHWHPKGWPMSWNFPSRQLLERTDEEWNRLCSLSDQRAWRSAIPCFKIISKKISKPLFSTDNTKAETLKCRDLENNACWRLPHHCK